MSYLGVTPVRNPDIGKQATNPPTGTNGNPIQDAANYLLSGAVGSFLAPLDQAIAAAIPRIGLFFFAIILFIIGALILKG